MMLLLSGRVQAAADAAEKDGVEAEDDEPEDDEEVDDDEVRTNLFLTWTLNPAPSLKCNPHFQPHNRAPDWTGVSLMQARRHLLARTAESARFACVWWSCTKQRQRHVARHVMSIL